MNPTTWATYKEYLDRVNEPNAAAALTLANAMQTSREDRPSAQPASGQPMTVPEVAKFLRVRPNKVLSWIRSGRLRGYNIAERENGRPKYRVNPDNLEAFMQQRAITQPAPKGRPPGQHGFQKHRGSCRVSNGSRTQPDGLEPCGKIGKIANK